jgi:hypothetical protein
MQARGAGLGPCILTQRGPRVWEVPAGFSRGQPPRAKDERRASRGLWSLSGLVQRNMVVPSLLLKKLPPHAFVMYCMCTRPPLSVIGPTAEARPEFKRAASRATFTSWAMSLAVVVICCWLLSRSLRPQPWRPCVLTVAGCRQTASMTASVEHSLCLRFAHLLALQFRSPGESQHFRNVAQHFCCQFAFHGRDLLLASEPLVATTAVASMCLHCRRSSADCLDDSFGVA